MTTTLPEHSPSERAAILVRYSARTTPQRERELVRFDAALPVVEDAARLLGPSDERSWQRDIGTALPLPSAYSSAPVVGAKRGFESDGDARKRSNSVASDAAAVPSDSDSSTHP